MWKYCIVGIVCVGCSPVGSRYASTPPKNDAGADGHSTSAQEDGPVTTPQEDGPVTTPQEDVPVTPSDDGGTTKPTDTTQTTPNPKGLVGHWKLDEASGTMASDSSGRLNHGMHEGVPTPSTEVPKLASPNPQSLLFNGGKVGEDAVVVPDSDSLSLAGPFTLAAWVRPATSKELVRPQQGLIEKWDQMTVMNPPPDAAASISSNGYYLRMTSAKNIQLGIRNQAGMSYSEKSLAALAENTWTHVAAVYDGTSVILYINGVQDFKRLAKFGPAPGTSNLEIGRRLGFNSFDGHLDDVRIYDRALSAAQVMDLSAGGN
jgi:hypothetical protein